MATNSDEDNNNKMTTKAEATQVSVHGWTGKQKGVYTTVGCNSAFKRKEMLTQATTQMNLEDIRLSEIRQLPKDKYYMTLLLRGSSQTYRDRKHNSGCQGPGREEMGMCFTATVSVPQDEKSFGAPLHNTVDLLNTTEL